MADPVPDTAHDPFVPPEASPRGARALAVAAWVLALLAIFQLPIVIGPLGMATGLVAHVKGDRTGLAAAIVAGVTTMVGMALVMLLQG